MQAVDDRRVDAIVAEDLSRISRDFADAAAIFKRLQYIGVPLIGIADGIDTGAKSAKLTFTIKSLVADIYLDDLRDKTRRGLEGRCRAGFSTGGLPFGYRTEAALTPDGRELGRRIVIDEEAAAIVRRVFTLYLEGLSYDAIAKRFNAEGVPYARLKTKHRRRGWVASSVRAMLWNASYVGQWTYGRREWRKVPGLNVRRPRERQPSEVISQTFAERRIITPELWDAVRARAAAVGARYKAGRKTGTAPGNKTNYPLSGTMFCGMCGAAMIVASGTSATYYSCGDARKRGTCANRTMLREDAVRAAVLQAVRDALFRPSAIAFLRKKIAERLRAIVQTGQGELEERAARLKRTEDRIRGLVHFISNGDDSKYVRETLKDLEAQARVDGAEIEALKRSMRAPIALPTPEALLARARDLDAVFKAEPLRAREALRGVFENGRLTAVPQEDGSYVVRGVFLPLVAVAAPDVAATPARDDGSVGLPLEIPVPKPADRRFKKTT